MLESENAGESRYLEGRRYMKGWDFTCVKGGAGSYVILLGNKTQTRGLYQLNYPQRDVGSRLVSKALSLQA